MVSVVIPTYNAGRYLLKLIDSLAKQTLSHQLIFLDSESSDNTQSLINKAGITVIPIPKTDFNHGATRNIGVALAKYDIVIFLTQDALPAANDTLEKLVNSLYAEDHIAMAYGRQLPYAETGIFGKFARYTNYPAQSLVKDKSLIPQLGIKTCSCSNSFAVYRKERLKNIGGFPEDTILGEDVSVAARFIEQGFSVAYCAEAQVFHSHDYSPAEEFRRYFDIGVFHYQQRAVLKQFTKAESEGLKYVLEESEYLIREGVPWLIPAQYVRTVAKYVGYKIGRMHTHLPLWLNKKLSMHSSFWK